MTKILVYDLDAKFKTTIQAVLTSLGYEAVIANDGYSVLPLTDQHKPGLIILDYKIPGADGFEILQRLRKTASGAKTPVIFASTTPKFEIEMVVMDAPEIGYIDKPLDSQQLKEAIESLIGKPVKAAPPPPPQQQQQVLSSIPPPGAPLPPPQAPSFTGEADLDGSRDDVINLD
ncbi:MAG: response regulator [Elusimicrobia bacterium]|nr:response regulator [Elusimicrobiota bacterium]